MNNAMKQIRVSAIAALIVFAAGCGGGGGDSSPMTAAADTPTPPAGGTNSTPTIQGQPGASVLMGQSYSFLPAAKDADGDTLTFTAANVPDWATFNTATGRLSGTPAAADVGTYSGITITVSDGKATASTAAFAIVVTAVGSATATISWIPPTSNMDGSVLTDLASYRILYGRSVDDLSLTVDVSNPGMSRFVVENLTSGAWYFAVIAVNSAGVTSPLSNVASKTVG